MSLKVWLPFIKDSLNIGTSNIAIDATDVSFSDDGKLGRCASITSLVNLNIPQSIYNVYTVEGTEISYSLWLKVDKEYLNQLISETDFSVKTQIYNKIIGFYRGSTSSGVGIHLRTDNTLTSSTVLDQIYVYSYLRNGSAASGSAATLINLDEWYHLVVTYSASDVLSFYINGSLIDSRTIKRAKINTSISDQTVRLNTPVCQLSSSQSDDVYLFSLKEYVNDVRIYDHALSVSEVKELSHGLILHYKLNDCNSIYSVDSSGYGRHGVVVGDLSVQSDSARYNSCLYSSTGLSNYITTPSLYFNPDAVTMSIWFKSSNTTPTGDYHMIVDSVENRTWYEMAVYKNGYFRGGLVVNGTRYADNSSITTLLDGNWHMFSITYDGSTIKRYVDGVSEKSTSITKTTGLSSPTALKIFKDGASNTYACMQTSLCDFRIYATALSEDDILNLYRTNARISKSGNLFSNVHTYEFVESNVEAITNSGQIVGHNIMELYPNLHYDKNIYIEPDGSKWIHLAHHNNPSNGMFSSSSSTWDKGVYENEDRWYDMEQTVGQADKFEFMVKQKNTSSSPELRYRWIQEISPLIATYVNVKPDQVTRIITEGYTDGGYGGLYLHNTNARTCIANETSSNWFGAFGCWTARSSGVPGYPPNNISTGYMDLYFRVDDFPALCAKIIKDYGFYADKLVEM